MTNDTRPGRTPDPAIVFLAALSQTTPAHARGVMTTMRPDDFDDWRARHVFNALATVLDGADGDAGPGPLLALMLDELMSSGHLDESVPNGAAMRRYVSALPTVDVRGWDAGRLGRILLHQTYRRRAQVFGEVLAERAPGASLADLDATISDGIAELRALRSRLDVGASEAAA